MKVLFPNNPLEPTQVDPDFEPQWTASKIAGFDPILFSHETLTESPQKAVRKIPEGTYLYRGWMLKPRQYRAFSEALSEKGASLLVSPEAYEYGHHLPRWYPHFQKFTAETVWNSSGSLEDARALLGRLPAGGAIVKDYVKSAKHKWEEACFIEDLQNTEKALWVIQNFLEEQGEDLNGGVVLRSFRKFRKQPEKRVFLWKGRGVMGEELPELEEAIQKLESPFVSVDLAQLEEGSWEVVEVGDAQVSGLRDLDPLQFYQSLLDLLRKK